MLADKILHVEKWIRDTLSQAKSVALPKTFKVIPEKETPSMGNSFDVLWVRFEFGESEWDDDVMWDIRYLLMGSKMNKIYGYPVELRDIREKLYISRDGFSERGRRARKD